jgi:hypothetical protein
MLLCDYAEEVNGKLYIMGGGWSRAVISPNAPLNMALAIKLSVPWIESNRRHAVMVRLLKENFEPATFGENEQEIRLSYNVEVGRPPGVRPGSYLDAPLAARFQGLALPAGLYLWEFAVNGRMLKRIPFEVVDPQL